MTRKNGNFEDIEFLLKQYGSFIKKKPNYSQRNYKYYQLKELIAEISKLGNHNSDQIRKKKLVI